MKIWVPISTAENKIYLILLPECSLTSSQWEALCPVTSYIQGTLLFTALETFNIWDQYRVYPSDEERKRNKASVAAVITHAIAYHGATTALSLVYIKVLPPLQQYSDCFGSYADGRLSASGLLGVAHARNSTQPTARGLQGARPPGPVDKVRCAHLASFS